ncbi:MAG TPA: hypothetical protein VGE74_21015, partial [Gemmata sp.]
MTRFGFSLALALTFALAVTTGAAAQPGAKPPGVVQFKQFGSTPEQFWQSSVTRWTGQVALDLETIKGEIAAAKLGALGRAALAAQVDHALRQVIELDQLVRKGAPKDRVFGAYAETEKALGGMLSAIEQNPTAKRATAVTLARLDVANHQLAAAVGANDNNAERANRRLQRLCDSLDDSIEQLRTLCADSFPNERALDRALSGYSKGARVVSRRVRDNAPPAQVKQAYLETTEAWGEAAAVLARVRAVPAPVSAQAARVDALHRRLGAALGAAPGPAGA